MCPKSWPQLSPAADRGLRRPALRRGAGRGDPPVRRRRHSRRRPRRAWRTRPTARFRHPAVAPLAQIGARHFRARAVPRSDARLQGPGDAVPRAADGSRARRSAASAPPSWSRPPAIPAARRSRRSAAATSVDVFVLYPHGRISDVQRRMMTTAERRQRPCARDRRHLRRLPGDREGPVQSPRLPRPACGCRASTRSTGRASSRRWSIISPPRSRSARRTARSPSPCRPGISATCSPAMSASAWGCRSTGW